MGKDSPCLAMMVITTTEMGARRTVKLKWAGFAPEDRQTPRMSALKQSQEQSPLLRLGSRISSGR